MSTKILVNVYGDNTIRKLKTCDQFTSRSYGNISLREFLIYDSCKGEDEDIVVTFSDFLKTENGGKKADIRIYAFGYFDIDDGILTNYDLVDYYQKLPRGNKKTYIIFPPNGNSDLYHKMNDKIKIIIPSCTIFTENEYISAIKTKILEIIDKENL